MRAVSVPILLCPCFDIWNFFNQHWIRCLENESQKFLCPSKFSVTRTSSVKARPPLFHVTQETLKWANANSSFPPTLKEQHCGFFLRPTRIRTVKELWDGANGFSSSSEKTRTSNHFRRPNKGSTLYSVILRQTPSVDPAGVRARDPLRGFVWLLTDWRIVSVADRALKKTRRNVKGSIS